MTVERQTLARKPAKRTAFGNFWGGSVTFRFAWRYGMGVARRPASRHHRDGTPHLATVSHELL